MVSKTRQGPWPQEDSQTAGETEINQRIIKINVNTHVCVTEQVRWKPELEPGMPSTAHSGRHHSHSTFCREAAPTARLDDESLSPGSTTHAAGVRRREDVVLWGCLERIGHARSFDSEKQKAREGERKVNKAFVLLQKNTELLYYSHFISGLKDKTYKTGSFTKKY